MLSLSRDSMKISSIFKRYRNDIIVFTEDKDKDKEFYIRLIDRLIGGELRIKDVTPLGNKSNVINYCRKSKIKNEVFIIDGDLGVVHNKVELLPRLFILDRYCIENYIIDENSVIKYIYNNCGKYSEKIIKEKLNYSIWLEKYAYDFCNLFIHFAIADNYNLPFKLYHALKYCSVNKDAGIVFNSNLIKEDIINLKFEIISNIGEAEYNEIITHFYNKYQPSVDTLLKIVSGKNYLIPLMQIKNREFTGGSENGLVTACKINLVQHCDLTSLNNLKTFLTEHSS